MLHSTLDAAEAAEHGHGLGARVAQFIRARTRWLTIVALPTAIIAFYYFVIAAGQYESEAHFLVRSTQSQPSPSAGLGQALSLIGGASSAPADASSVSDYLSSHDAVDALRKGDDLVGMFRRPEADFIAKLYPATPTPERLLNYFRDHVDVKLDADSGITVIRARTFRPGDSYRLVDSMLALGEARVNILNKRAYESSIAVARRQLAEAEQAVAASQTAMTAFRQTKRNIDPVATGAAQIQVVSGLQAMLAQARAQQSAMASAIRADSPQSRAMDQRVRALEQQLAAEQGRLAGQGNAIATNVGDYQGLQLRQQFASKRYDDAAAALQRAREQANKQQLFIVRVVDPNMPVKALYPKGGKVVLTVFVGLALAYALGWLIIAGVREHAA